MSAQSAKRVVVVKNHPTIDRPSSPCNKNLTKLPIDKPRKVWYNKYVIKRR